MVAIYIRETGDIGRFEIEVKKLGASAFETGIANDLLRDAGYDTLVLPAEPLDMDTYELTATGLAVINRR